MKKKFSPDLLKEELNRFRLISEYDFYQEKKEEPKYTDIKEEGEETPPADLAPADDDVDAAADKVSGELGLDGNDGAADGAAPEMTGAPETAQTPPPAPAPPAAPASDGVEVDVTSLVKGSEDAKNAADSATKNTQTLLQKMNDLESRVAHMSKISDRIEGLEQEIIKRNPTPVEKLEMRSLDSAPFTQKLSDYWSDKEGAYDVMNKNGEEKKEEYILTQDDVDSGYSDGSVKKSFSPDQKNLFEEEDISDYDVEII